MELHCERGVSFMSELLNRQLALRWLKYAENDLHAATIMLSRDDVAPWTVMAN